MKMNKKKINLTLLSLFLLGTSIYSQPQGASPILITLDGKGITVSEFENIYRKNNSPDSHDPKSLDEYLQLFVNFKLKVKEAEELGYDTTEAFKNELSGYRKQLSQPYLIDKELNENLVIEAYERTKWDIKAKHLLIRMASDASPKDTLLAYNKVMEYKKRLNKGEKFDKLISEIKNLKSEDVLAEDLGYFTCFQMVYPFETIAYLTSSGSVSDPVRTRFGYHLIYVEDKRPARGQIKVAHIMVSTSEDFTEEQKTQAKSKIQEIYGKLQSGEDFGQLARTYSDDKGSASKAGVLPWFGTGKMVGEFEDAAFLLKNENDISEPIKTKYGWHIIKRLEYKGIESFEEIKGELKNKIARDGRATVSRESLIKKLKEEYGVQPNMKNLAEYYALADESYFNGEWKLETKAKELNKPLFSITDTKYSNNKETFTQKEFSEYLISNMRKQPLVEPRSYVNQMFEKYLGDACISFEEKNLEAKYPEFRLLIQEYRDGILLFELMDKKVWSKAVSDTIGLRQYYENNKTKFLWPERVEASIYTCQNETVYKKTMALVKKKVKKGYTDEYIKNEVNTDSQLNLKVEKGLFQKSDNELIDNLEWKQQITSGTQVDGKTVFVSIDKVLPPQPKSLVECKGLVTAEYQAHLEKEWIQSLDKKYEVHVDRQVLSGVKN